MPAKIYYVALPDEWRKQQKLDWLSEHKKFDDIPFLRIEPDENGNWINQPTAEDWHTLIPIADKDVKLGRKKEGAIFELFSLGVSTNRDEWVYDFQLKGLEAKIQYFISKFKAQITTGETEDNELDYSIKWSESQKSLLKKSEIINYNSELITKSLYRPFVKRWYYFDPKLSDRLTSIHQTIFGTKAELDNLVINISGGSSSKPFQTLAVKILSGLDFLEKTQGLPLYRYEKGARVENITDWALGVFRERYGAGALSPLLGGAGGGFPSSEHEANTLSPLLGGAGGGFSSSEHEANTLSPLLGGAGGGFPSSEHETTASAKVSRPNKTIFEYNPALVKLAKENRKNLTKGETYIWNRLKGKQLLGVDFDRQKPIGNYIVDFFCNERLLVVEIDGASHYVKAEADAERQAYLENLGLTVLRFTEENCVIDPDGVVRALEVWLKTEDPTPNPSQEGSNTQEPTPDPSQEGSKEIEKIDIFHYVYTVLHYPAYRKKYELNLKREFPRVPFYADFWKWAGWGAELMRLHVDYETVAPYPLEVREKAARGKAALLPPEERETPKTKLKAEKATGEIILDENTTLVGVPKEAWEYRLGNRSALEWILDQYKETKIKDPTIAAETYAGAFKAYCFADYKSEVIDLLARVCTVSVETARIITEMEKETE